ncbi:MAG: hypothetical protein ACD_75C02069G0002 [uncultured bacterium]|nr:MAG: hypothetical protein ACD_75C02069G0002 [uncultured bacterium]HBG20319.1 hypothetical protein [Desulfobulbaceae bacterium]
MHCIKSFTAPGRCRHLIVSICLLFVFLNGCAILQPKKVVSPPARTTVSKRPAEVPVPPVKSSPYVAKPPVKDRPVVIRPPGAERPVVTKPPVEEGPIVIEPPVEERPFVTEPPVEERPLVTEPPVEEHPAVIEPPGDYKPITGRAAGIYNEAEEAMQAGRFAPAEMLLERALRIEPRNAHYWYTLGLAKFRQKQYPQAVQFCLKAESLAGSQPGLLARNQVLLTQAKKAAGMK